MKLGQTKMTLLQRNIALPDKKSDDGKPKTYHPSPIDREQISLWEDGDIPFILSFWYTGEHGDVEYLPDKEKDVIRRALKHISDNVPCIKFREVTPSTPGNKLIFSKLGDSALYPPFLFWAYLGMVAEGSETEGSVGFQIPDGQTVHIHEDCFSFQTVVRLVLISLGVADKLVGKENKRNISSDTQENLVDM